MDGGDLTERMITENPVVVVSRRSCCMCYAMKALLLRVGVKAAVIELEEAEVGSAAGRNIPPEAAPAVGSPVLFIGGEVVGGIERLMEMHLSGGLVPRLKEVGASFVNNY